MSDTLKVPGATLHYEVRGTGPVLLLICGGIYDAAGYAGLAGDLADRYTVVTYDRRGNSRSPRDEPAAVSVADHAEDAYRVLRHVTSEPAYVFGNSSGASIGLELAIRHPDAVRALVAHEPPVFDLLPDAEHWRQVMRDVAAAYDEGGAGAAGPVFGAAMGMSGGEPPAGENFVPDPEMLAMFARFEKNTDVFFGQEVPVFGAYAPDVDALRASPAPIVLAAGAASVGEPPHQAALALAARLDRSAEIFPGDHGGFGAEHVSFAGRLDEVLTKRSA
jgi:pimeloyl-ACP methyl ester carboxylesterase